MTAQTLQVEIPTILLQRAHIPTGKEARELITYLLENYVQELERSQRYHAYELYYSNRTPTEITEESQLLKDFAHADTESIADYE